MKIPVQPTSPEVRARHRTLSETDNLFQGIKPSPCWNFWRDGVTSSFLDLFTTCLEQTRLAYVEGWSSTNIPLAIEFGSCCHWVLEQLYNDTEIVGRMVCRPTGDATEHVQRLVRDYAQKWRAETQMPTEAQMNQQELVYGIADTMLPWYLSRWDGDFRQDRKYTYGADVAIPDHWISLERQFRHPFIYPDGRMAYVNGKSDGVFRDKRGRIWVFDTKCRSVIQEDDLTATMPFDPQFMLYAWVVWREQGIIPSGIVQNIIRRSQKRLNSYRSMKEMLDTLWAEVPKKMDYYFIRLTLNITADELRSWEKKVLEPTMRSVRMWWEGKLPHYPNYRNLTTKYGRCSLFAAMTRNDFSGCYRRQRPFSELRDF